jgi:hypothetical protein
VSAEQGSSSMLSIAFSHEELVVLAELCDLQLPMLGERPLPALSGVSREAVLDVAARSLLARGVLVRSGDEVGLVRAATGLLEIVSASSLRVEVIRQGGRDGSDRSWRTIHAVPYAAVDTSLDHNGNHRFAPFATEDLLLHVGRLTGLLGEDGELSPADDAGGAAEGTSMPFGVWRSAGALVRSGADADALAALVDGGASAAVAGELLEVLRSDGPTAAVQVRHHPSPTSTAGGEVAWIDAGDAGVWLVPTIDQPFGRLPRSGEADDARVLREALALDAGDGPDAALDGVVVTIAPTTGAAVLRDLHSVLPSSP